MSRVATDACVGRSTPWGASVVGAGCIDLRGALAPRLVRAAVGLATTRSVTRAVRSWPPGERLLPRLSVSITPQRLTFQTQRATTLQPQTVCLLTRNCFTAETLKRPCEYSFNERFKIIFDIIVYIFVNLHN